MKPARFPKIFLIVPLLVGVLIGTVVIKNSSAKTEEEPIATYEPVPEEKPLEDEGFSSVLIAAATTKEEDVQTEATNTNAASEKATIPAGEQEVKVCSDDLTPNSQVYLTSESGDNLVLFVKRKVPFNPETGECSHFVAAINQVADKDIDFRWWVIQ